MADQKILPIKMAGNGRLSIPAKQRKGPGPGERRHRRLLALPLTVIDLDVRLAIEAGAMIAQTKPFGLSLGDRACLALAPLIGIEVRLIR